MFVCNVCMLDGTVEGRWRDGGGEGREWSGGEGRGGEEREWSGVEWSGECGVEGGEGVEGVS